MNRSDAADRLERLLRRDLDAAARESGPPSEEDIDAYVSGRAGKVEREILEQHLAENPALQAEVDALVEMRRAIGDDTVRRDEREPRDRTVTATTQRPAGERALVGAVGGASRKTERRVAKGEESRPSGARAAPPRARQFGQAPTRWETAIRSASMGALAASLVILALWLLTNRGAPPPDQVAGGASGAGGATSAGGGGQAATGNPTAGGAGSGGAGNPAAGGGASSNVAAGNPPAGGAGGAVGGGGAVSTLTLRDGSAEVSLLSNGTLRGLEAVPAADRSEIARALASGRLVLSSQIGAVATPSGVLLSPDGTSRAFRVTAPLATAVRSGRPTFSWTRHADATGYRVRIEDAGGTGGVIESPLITATSWTPPAALPVGRVLTWQVEAQTPQGVVRAPVPPLPEARFIVLREGDRKTLESTLDAARGSDLATAVALARFGVLDEADVALARLAAANPNADVIKQVQRRLAERRFPR